MGKSTINVQGMSCGHCVAAVKNAILAIQGVTGADVDLAAGKAVVEHDPAVATLEKICLEIENEGYTAKS